jgi:hypothetical protein
MVKPCTLHTVQGNAATKLWMSVSNMSLLPRCLLLCHENPNASRENLKLCIFFNMSEKPSPCS